MFSSLGKELMLLFIPKSMYPSSRQQRADSVTLFWGRGSILDLSPPWGQLWLQRGLPQSSSSKTRQLQKREQPASARDTVGTTCPGTLSAPGQVNQGIQGMPGYRGGHSVLLLPFVTSLPLEKGSLTILASSKTRPLAAQWSWRIPLRITLLNAENKYSRWSYQMPHFF